MIDPCIGMNEWSVFATVETSLRCRVWHPLNDAAICLSRRLLHPSLASIVYYMLLYSVTLRPRLHYKPTESSRSGFFRFNHILATSYVPRYKPLPNAVHADLKSPPRKKPRVPLSLITSFVTSHAPFLGLPSASPSPAVNIILVFTTSLGVVIHAAKAPAPAALPPLTRRVSSSVDGFPPSRDEPSFSRKCSNAGN